MLMPAGRPLKFKTVKEFCEKADKYFSSIPKEKWTITGLALALDTTRDVLIDYQNRDEFTNAIKRYKQMVEESYEEILKAKGHSGAIFALKNFKWTDKQEIDHTTQGEKITGFNFISNGSNNKTDPQAGASVEHSKE